MSRKSRMQSAREAKDKRMKKVAVGLCVVLVAVLAFEVPNVMHRGNSSAAPPAATTATGTSTTATSLPGTAPATVPGTTAAAVLPAASTKLPNSDAQPQRTKSTLASFSHFSGKDPFVQQVATAAPTGVQTAGATTSQGSSGSSGSASSGTSKPKKVRTLAANGTARIAVNGRIETVRVGGSFPSANPLFRLVGISNGVARIGIANGSYTSGAHTISLSGGRTLTLVDTADSIRYTLRLITA
jgi:hypothetical protein